MKSLIVFSFSMLLSLVGLLALWVTAAHAAEPSTQRPVMSECVKRPLANGRPGESVLVCETVRKVRGAQRVGVTTVLHVGR